MNFRNEMGIFLGYPVEDVVGYLKNNGENSVCVGYWKVYKNVEEKQKLFKEFEYAKESVIRYLAQGMNILDVMKHYSCKDTFYHLTSSRKSPTSVPQRHKW